MKRRHKVADGVRKTRKGIAIGASPFPLFPSSPRRCHRGSILLEVMLAVTIIGFALTGFALVVQQTMVASKTASQDLRMRLALESRINELQAQRLRPGEEQSRYNNSEIVVLQKVEPAELRNEDEQLLTGLWRVHLKASLEKISSIPMEAEVVIFQR